MYVSLEDLQKYTGVYDDKKNVFFCYSACDIINNYLGYSPEYKDYSIVASGKGSTSLQLTAKPIREIKEVKINGEEADPTIFLIREEFIIFPDERTFPEGINNVVVKFEAGFHSTVDPYSYELDGGEADTNFDDGSIYDGGTANSVYDEGALETDKHEFPLIIKNTGLRIAALLLSEADSNIGVTSKSFGESGSRTFVNYTNFDKYLSPLSRYRLITI
jgi:hypothetical protein